MYGDARRRTPTPPARPPGWEPTHSARVHAWYSRAAPWYDRAFARLYRRVRRESLAAAGICPSDRVLLIGVGTGLDLPHLDGAHTVIGADLVPAMLRRARDRRPRAHMILGDAVRLPLRDETVDVAVLHLVLSVVDSPGDTLLEAARVLVPGGRLAICDHIAPPTRLPWYRKVSTRAWGLFGTRFDLRLEPFLEGLPFEVTSDRRAMLGCYRLLGLTRTTERAHSRATDTLGQH
jgi:ubiquinone/menaquinone biosynthesis C-methylase UbiE